MRHRAALLFLGVLTAACAIPDTIAALDDRSPPPEFGRPTWVRVSAGVGAWVGGVLGGVVSIVALPITYPLSVLAEDGLGEHAASEFMLFPALGGAAVGHALLGTPPDVVDWVFRRAWVGAADPVTSFEFIPLPAAVLPEAVVVPVKK